MSEYGVTKDGFVLKRMDTILEEIHSELTEKFGFDTRITRPSVLDTIVTTFGSQIADLWEVAQDSYYAKYPATAEGINLDNAVQFGGIRRASARKTSYPIHCEGDDGTSVTRGVVIATDTKPEIRLTVTTPFTITRSACNEIGIITAVVGAGVYSIAINGDMYSCEITNEDQDGILTKLAALISGNAQYTANVLDHVLRVVDTVKTRNNVVVLSDNLTTKTVTTIATFETEEYGRITVPNGVITKIITNVAGLKAVDNKISPAYGRLSETDSELRKSYIARSALRSSNMLESITAELINNVGGVISASAFQNDTDVVDESGLPPHSIEIVVEGGDSSEIAEAILAKKAGGIQSYGSELIEVPTKYGQNVPVRFSRPTYLYTWFKVLLSGTNLPNNATVLVRDSIMNDTRTLGAGESLLVQLLHEGIYDSINGLSHVTIKVAYSTDKNYIPKAAEYVEANIITTKRQMVVAAESRIEVAVNDS